MICARRPEARALFVLTLGVVQIAPNGPCLRGFDRPPGIPGWAKSGRGALPRAEPRAQPGFKGDARAGCLAIYEKSFKHLRADGRRPGAGMEWFSTGFEH